MFNFKPSCRSRVPAVLAGLCVVALCAAPAHGQAISFNAQGLSLGIDTDGKVYSLLDTVTGVDRIISSAPESRKYLCKITVAGTEHIPTQYERAANLLTYTFGTVSPAVVASVRIEEHPRYLVLTLEALTNADGLDEVCFVNIWTRDPIEGTAYRFLKYDDNGVRRHMGICPLDVFTRTLIGSPPTGNYLTAHAYPDLPHPTPVAMTGRRAALFACDADDNALYDVVGQIEQDYDIPLGVAGKQLPAMRKSCIFWMWFNYDQRDLALQYTLDAGAGRIILHANEWGDLRRKMVPPERWGGVTGLRDWLDECKAAGLLVGAHLFPGGIHKDSIDYIYAGCDPRLRRDHWATLATDLPATQTSGVIETTAPPTGWPATYGNRELVIGQEIIEYAGVRTTEPPYGFSGPFVRAKNQTGEGGLGPQDHAAGAVIGHLDSTDSDTQYQWDIASGGVAQWCSDLASSVEQVGFQFVNTDALERTQEPRWYTMGLLSHTLVEAVPTPLLALEASVNTAAYSWSLLSIDGQTDYRPQMRPFKSEVDRNVTRIADSFWSNGYIPQQLGWARLSTPLPGLPHTTPDELEYLLAKSVAHDCPVVVQLWMQRVLEWPNRDANFALMKKYEQLRLAGYFSGDVRTAARRPQKDFMLFTDQAGEHHLVPTSMLSIASWSTQLRGYITDRSVAGSRYVTLWPTAADVQKTLFLDGVSVADVSVQDTAGDPIQVTDVGGGQIAIPLTTRVYICLSNVPDPQRCFANATVRDAQ